MASKLVSCHATCPQNASAASTLAEAWRTEVTDALGDDYARHALTERPTPSARRRRWAATSVEMD